MVLPADKGRAVVVLDRSEYDGKIRALLDESTTYCTINKDPTPSREREMKSTLLSLYRKDELPK